MEVRYEKHWSGHLNREMEFKVYGHSGKPVLFIPCQAGRFWDFEGFNMDKTWAPWIESGQVMVFSCDSIDNEAWAAMGADNRWRIENHEKWFRYITLELVPAIKHIAGTANGYDQGILTFGCSLGATHAANLFFRFPDVFCGCLAISGIFTSEYGFGSYMDDLVYNNCPVNYIANMPADHPYMALYNRQKSLIVVGQGDWEGPLLESTRRLDTVCAQKGIHTRFEYWGYDVAHDWPWWFKMVAHYVPQLLY